MLRTNLSIIFVILIVFLGADSIRFASAIGIGTGHCAHVSAVHVSEWNFSGRWYEARRVLGQQQSNEGRDEERCNFEEYRFTKDKYGWNLWINSTGLVARTPEESILGDDNGEPRWRSSVVEARQYSRSRNSALGYFVLGAGSHKGARPQPRRSSSVGLPRSDVPNFFILHADANFSLVYFCQNFQGHSLKMDLAWIMSRERYPNPWELNRIETVLEKNGILDLEMVDVDQYDCPEMPPAHHWLESNEAAGGHTDQTKDGMGRRHLAEYLKYYNIRQ